ncbi:hypothetical protein PV05_07465 [Exophiala xenobiotica]|uniref:Uncharacterized protein n=1 Tax=Exophiala xenobiotica TaxID=348802 RepID=A0A0D2BRP7_9EURO|nr:uncharacterized protein PV05_07465 [Exophiala xenobiotica]KIW55161.1 hypothetical protein PV05_07465 [Exophiala xenobiotica]
MSDSIPRYKRKMKEWGFKKNHKSSEWQAIDRGLNRRSLDQSTARVTIKDSTLGPRKIERGLRRHVVPSLKRKWKAVDSPDTPEHIRIVKGFPRELLPPWPLAANSNVPLKDLDWPESLVDYVCGIDKYRGGPICFPTALEYAMRGKSTAAVELLLKRGAGLSACFNGGSHGIVRRLIQAGADINSPTHSVQGPTALQWAAVRGDIDLLKYLLSHGADINAPAATEYGYTALQAAVLYAAEEAVDLILDWGADVNSDTKNELLFWKLIKAGTDVNLVEWEDCDNENNNHVLVAAGSKSTKFFRWLLDLGVDFDTCLRSGYTLGDMALLRAIEADNPTMVHRLLERNTILSSDILTQALHSLALYTDNANYEVEVALLDRGADLRCQLWCSRTLLQIACTGSSLNHVQELVRRGADVNAPPLQVRGQTALQAASARGHVPLVKLLLGHGADVNAQAAPEWGLTALQAASAEGHIPAANSCLITERTSMHNRGQRGGEQHCKPQARKDMSLLLSSCLITERTPTLRRVSGGE